MKFYLLLFFVCFVPHLSWGQNQCAPVFQQAVEARVKDASELRYRTRAIEIMVKSSLPLSRTKFLGEALMPQQYINNSETSRIAERNFIKTATLIAESYENLELNLSTLKILYAALNQDLVASSVPAVFNFRQSSPSSKLLDGDIGTSPKDFYVTWLKSKEAKLLFESKPVVFAEKVHNAISALDSFPDGNGRLARMFADLALLKAGLAPLFHPSREDYFRRGNPLSGAERSVRQQYFIEAEVSGLAYLGFKFD